jgi:hypothetical protein
MSWCEQNDVDYVLGLAQNERLKKDDAGQSTAFVVFIGGDKSILPMETRQQRPLYALVEGLSLENRPIFSRNNESIAIPRQPEPPTRHKAKAVAPPAVPNTKKRLKIRICEKCGLTLSRPILRGLARLRSDCEGRRIRRNTAPATCLRPANRL